VKHPVVEIYFYHSLMREIRQIFATLNFAISLIFAFFRENLYHEKMQNHRFAKINLREIFQNLTRENKSNKSRES